MNYFLLLVSALMLFGIWSHFSTSLERDHLLQEIAKSESSQLETKPAHQDSDSAQQREKRDESSVDELALQQAEDAIGEMMRSFDESGEEGFREKLQAVLMMLAAAEDLTSAEFIRLVDRLDFSGSKNLGWLTEMIMRRIGAQVSPELILFDPPDKRWSQEYALIAFRTLLDIDIEGPKKWLEQHRDELKPPSKELFEKFYWNASINKDPEGPQEFLEQYDGQFVSDLEISNPAARKLLAELVVQKITSAQSKERLTSSLMNGAFKNGESQEMIDLLQQLYPDDEDGRILALLRSQVLRGNFKIERVEKLLTVARASSPASEERVLRNALYSIMRKDLAAAGNLLTALPDSSARNAGLETYAQKVAKLDKESALEWAGEISDLEASNKVQSSIIEQWLGDDPDSANAWLEKKK